VEQIRREREQNERIEQEQEAKQQRLQQEIRQRTATAGIRKFRQRVRISNSVENTTFSFYL
jgi:hypothetical protein